MNERAVPVRHELRENLPDGAARAAVHFRFYDNREKYLLFVTTTNEKATIAEQIGRELRFIHPKPPALRIFDAGMGDGMVLSRVMRRLHRRFPTVPWFVVGKEISVEDVRLTLDKMPERFFEHPQMVVAITNMYYSEAPALRPRSPAGAVAWIELELEGGSTEEFEAQIAALLPRLPEVWRVRTSPTTGNPLRERPAVIVLYRKDQKLALDRIIPRPENDGHDYHLIIASQPYRARASAATKVRMVLAPLARALAPGGRLVTATRAWRSSAASGRTTIRSARSATSCSTSPGRRSRRTARRACAILLSTTSARCFAMRCTPWRPRSARASAPRPCSPPGTPPCTSRRSRTSA